MKEFIIKFIFSCQLHTWCHKSQFVALCVRGPQPPKRSDSWREKRPGGSAVDKLYVGLIGSVVETFSRTRLVLWVAVQGTSGQFHAVVVHKNLACCPAVFHCSNACPSRPASRQGTQKGCIGGSLHTFQSYPTSKLPLQGLIPIGR